MSATSSEGAACTLLTEIQTYLWRVSGLRHEIGSNTRLSVRLWTFWRMTLLWHAGPLDQLSRWIGAFLYNVREVAQNSLFLSFFGWVYLWFFHLKKTVVYKCQVSSPCVYFTLVTKNLLCSFVVADSECESLLEAELVPVQLGGGPTRLTNDPPTWPPADRAPCFQVSNPPLHPPADGMMACLTAQKVFQGGMAEEDPRP